eukprot:1190169-Pleurochrysis_carterae.AAC.1
MFGARRMEHTQATSLKRRQSVSGGDWFCPFSLSTTTMPLDTQVSQSALQLRGGDLCVHRTAALPTEST